MSLPSVLLVDDSDAILAFERAALAAHYQVHTASNGRTALESMKQLAPELVLLDLSMPEMDGEEVLAHMQSDTILKLIPVVVISTERARAEACVHASGATAYLPKPIREDDLLALVARVLDEVRQKRRRGSLATLFVCVGELEFGVPLNEVWMVLQQPATRPLAVGPSYLSQLVEIHGSPIVVLDTARRLGVEHRCRLPDRMLVVIEHEGQRLALSVDQVRDPEEIPAEDVIGRERLGGSDHGPLREVLLAVVKTARGAVPVIAPGALLSRELLTKIGAALAKTKNEVAV